MEEFGLTTFENRVLELVAEGLSNQEIAIMLSKGKRAIENHVKDIMEKLSVKSRTAAAKIYWAIYWRRHYNTKNPG